MPPSSALRKAARWARLTFLLTLSLSWLFLYINSTLQRRKAEHFISNLKSFPFAVAGFIEVRDLALRNGGGPIQPSISYSAPKCTIQNCDFDISIKSLSTVLSLRWQGNECLDSILA